MENNNNNNNNKKPKNKNTLRRALMLSGLLVVMIGAAYLYFTGGRYITTDNAYVKAAKIMITPEVDGTIIAVAIDDNEQVKKGALLFKIDPAAYEIALQEATAELTAAEIDVARLKAQYRQKTQDLERIRLNAAFAENEYERRIGLVDKGVIARSEFDESKRQRDSARQSVAALEEEISGLLAALAGNPDIAPQDHPAYLKVLAAKHEAELDLLRTEVRAPADGIIGIAPHVGDYARASVPLVNLVASDEIWIEANYKETELTHVKIGQPVTIEVDTYPDRQWSGRVESISPATGAEFSILPAQNATGNWVKVVQRIAVKIPVEDGPEDLSLRTGMSAHVTIDTGTYPHGLNRKG